VLIVLLSSTSQLPRMSATPPAPTDKIKILTVDDQNVECIATKWPPATVPSSAFYAKAHWRAKAMLITDKVAQFGVAKISAPGNAKYIVYARVAFPKEGEEVAIPEQLKNDRGRLSGPVFFNPPADLPADCERLEEVPHELYTHVMGDIKWPLILKRRNLVAFADPISRETRQVPLLPSYLYDERVKYERWKVTILTWWEANRGGRVGHHRLMRWQNIFQDFRREYASYPYEAGAVRRFSSIVQAYERELQAGRPIKIENWLAAEDQHHRAGAAAVSLQRVSLSTAPATSAAAEAAPPRRLPVAQSALSSSSSSEASDDDGSASDSDAGEKKAPAAGKSAMAAARQRMRAHMGSDSDSDSGDSDSESDAPAPAKAAGKRPAPVAAAKPPKRSAAAASSDNDSGSDSDSESEPEVKPAAKKAAAAASLAAAKKKAMPVADSDSSSSEEEARPSKQAIAAATAAAKAKANAAGKGRVNYDDSDDSDSDSGSDSGKRAVKAASAKATAKAAPVPVKGSSRAAEPSSESESESSEEEAKAHSLKAKAKAAKK
jgi:hypothetical protein